MPKAIYRGPGDTVELDGLEVKKGASIELTLEQIERIRAGGGAVDVKTEKGDK